jgi:hypothetical protein
MFVPLRPVVEASQPGDACRLLQEAGQGVVTSYLRPLPGDCPLTGALRWLAGNGGRLPALHGGLYGCPA